MRLRHIELFQALLQAGTLTGAARLLHISQPAASKLLQHAETGLGFALFERVNGRLVLTPQGRMMREHIERVGDELADLDRLARNVVAPGGTALRVVATPTLAGALLPSALRPLSARYADAQVQLLTQHTREIVDALRLRDADIGLTLQAVHVPGIRQLVLGESRAHAIAPPGYWSDDAMREPLPRSALAGQVMVGLDVRDALGRAVRQHLQDLAPPPRMRILVQTYPLARALVADGHGVAVVDAFTARTAGPAVQVRPLDPPLAVTLHALLRDGEPPMPVQRHFIDSVKRLARDYG
ncbi:LysR substrate-binding domain-containing protein [Pseudoxanthomonas sp.]|uniref:LysR family transcriptional regulator n=1 Tax=Pseudoxanthomonas sp. TaxID=1871049 RepID=UPI0025D1A855|nr:LysR substrate-binding domain-containing protein [Pseudoxanthomonas sp.]